MKLRTKTLLVLGVTLLGLNGVLYGVSSSILRNSVARSEEYSLRDRVNGVRYVLDQEIDTFSDNSLQWSNWDDTYNYIANPKDAYIQSNLVPPTYSYIKLNLFIALNDQNKIVYGRAFDLKTQQFLPIPPLLKKHLHASDPILKLPQKSQSLSGIIILPEGEMMITSQPILPSTGKGKVRGTMIWGRYISQELVDKLSKTSRAIVRLYPIKQDVLPPDVQQARAVLRQNSGIHIQRLDEETIAGYTIIRDIYGQPALILQLQDRREIYLLGQRRQRFLMISLLVVGIGFSGMSLLTLERLILSRLSRLSKKVKLIGEKGDLSLRLYLKGNDELSELAQTINGMLGAIEQQDQARKDSEERHRAIVEQSAEGILIIDAQTLQLREANPAIATLLGYTLSQLLELSLYDLQPHLVWQDNLQALMGEHQYHHKDGSLIDVEVNANLIHYGGRDVICVVMRDITDRKRTETEIRLLQTTTQAISEAPDFETSLYVTLQKVCQTIGWHYGEAWTQNPEDHTILCTQAWYHPDPDSLEFSQLQDFHHRSLTRKFQMGQGIPGRVWQAQQSEWIPNLNEKFGTFQRLSEAYQRGLKAVFAVPILTDDQPKQKVLAVLVLFHQEVQAQNQRVVDLVSAVAAQLGSVIQRKQAEAALRESGMRLRQQQNALLSLAQSQAIYMGHLTQAWRDITETACQTLQVERVSVWLYRDVVAASARARDWRSPSEVDQMQDSVLVCQDLYQRSSNEHHQGLELHAQDFPSYFQALTRDRVLVAPDAQTDPRTQEFLENYMTPLGICSMLDAPIQAAGRVVGVLCVEAVGKPRQWSLEEQNFVTYLGYMAALAIEASDRIQAEAKFRNIFENSVEGIFQTTPGGQYLNANPSLARIYGYDSPQELMTHLTDINCQLYVNPKRRQEFMEALDQHGSVADFQSQVYRRDRRIIWISESARTVRNDQGEVLYYEGTVEDITRRKVAEEALRYQQEQAERLLLNILPEPIALRLKQEEQTIADSFPEVSVLFADIVGFTQLSTTVSPIELVRLLNRIFSAFDRLAEHHQLEKIKTIGDAYMVVSGLPVPRADHAEAIANMALDMQREIEKFSQEIGTKFQMRIGINTGPVVAGVIGIKKFIYDLWGDTVNTASRMESHGIPGQIQVTAATYDCLKDHYEFESRGTIYIKGKGEMQTYLLKGQKVKVGQLSISNNE